MVAIWVIDMVTFSSASIKLTEETEALTLITSRQPVAHTYHTPIYSNMAFQLLGYAIEAITGEAFSETVNKYLIEPLKLARTFYFSPGNDTNAVIVDGWTRDLGDENP